MGKSPTNKIDLIGKTFGKLTVLRQGKGRKTSGGAYIPTWICKCECGKECEVDGAKLRKGHTTSCGCKKSELRTGYYKDLTGMRFNRLTVIRYIPENEREARGYNWLCRCDCGNEIKGNAYKLKKGLQQSCGCLKEELKYSIGELNRKYNHTNKRLYRIYRSMIERCTNPKHHSWHNYGGRGIKVCDEWLGEKGFDNFAEWALASGYDENAKYGVCTIDRNDCDGDYSPSNCSWKTNKQQQNNRRNNVLLEYHGETHNMKEWSEILNVPYYKITWHCRRYGRTIEQMLNIIGK